MFCIFLDAEVPEVPCHVIYFFPKHFSDDTGLMQFFFSTLQMTWEFAFFWVCPTTPMSSAGSMIIINSYKHILFHINK